ncbi:MAG TPA: ERAP1-like C-terminal domain-containing protein, partial [Candidatus Saccharimonadales bacterium]|nr:ERAP1-like C-terminal domain-containing protein [Candidatus Saccharimonadales bacterium]
PTVDVVNLLAHYSKESSYPVWQAMTSVTGALRLLINDDPAIKPHLQRYIASLAQPQFARLGWERIPGESYFDELLRPTVIGLLAYAEVPATVDKALSLFEAADKPEDIIMPELRGIVYSVAVREQGQKAFDKLLQWYKTTQSADERITLVAGLSALRDPKLGDQAITYFRSEFVKPQDVTYWFIYFLRNRHSRHAAWQWMVNNWDWISEQFKNSHDYPDFPKYSSGALSTEQELHDYKQFFEPKLQEQDIAMVIRQGIEEIEIRVAWRKRDLDAITTFLQNHKQSAA